MRRTRKSKNLKRTIIVLSHVEIHLVKSRCTGRRAWRAADTIASNLEDEALIFCGSFGGKCVVGPAHKRRRGSSSLRRRGSRRWTRCRTCTGPAEKSGKEWNISTLYLVSTELLALVLCKYVLLECILSFSHLTKWSKNFQTETIRLHLFTKDAWILHVLYLLHT